MSLRTSGDTARPGGLKIGQRLERNNFKRDYYIRPMAFTNNKFPIKQQFTLKDSGVLVNRSGLLDSIEYEIPFENIGTSKVVEVAASNSAFISSFFCFSFSIVMIIFDNAGAFLVFGSISLITLLFGVLTRVRKITIPAYGNESLTLYFKKNNKEQVIEFADELIQTVKNYLRKKYSGFDRLMPLEKQFENLYFLKERELITDAEYDQYKSYLLGTEKPSIGFSR